MKLIATGAISPIIGTTACNYSKPPEQYDTATVGYSSGNANIEPGILSQEYIFNSISSLKNTKLDVLKITESSSKRCVQVLGYYEPGDGGGGLFYWDSNSTKKDNTGTILKPTFKGFKGTGRWKRVINSRPLVEWFGAKGDYTTDDTAAFQKAITALDKVHASNKTYAIEGTIVLDSSKTLILNAATLNRTGVSTAPILYLAGDRSVVSGGDNGYGNLLNTSNESPKGVILLGSNDPENKSQNVLWNQIHNLNIYGNNSTNSIGIRLLSSQAYTNTGSVYFNTISDCLIQEVEEGIHLGSVCNGNTIHNIHFYKIGQYCYHFVGNEAGGAYNIAENMVQMSFVHFSGNLSSMIKLESCIYNLFYNITGESGSGYFYNIDSSSAQNQILGHSNFPLGSISSQSGGILATGPGQMSFTTLNTTNLTVGNPPTLPYKSRQSGSSYGTTTSVVNYETVFLNDKTKSQIKIAGLKRSNSGAYRAGLYYEIRLKGFASGVSGGVQFSATRIVNTYNFAVNDARISLEVLGADQSVIVSSDNNDQSITFKLLGNGWGDAIYGEITISIEAVGVIGDDPVVTIT